MAGTNYRTVNLTPELARSLKPGDVIENPYFGFWHPYIVDSVIPHHNSDGGADESGAPVTVRVIHYGRRDLLEGISVLQENIVLDFTDNSAAKFRLYKFPEAVCREDDEVVQLARVRIGEAQHRVFSNNATYFALYCKLKEEAYERYRSIIGGIRVYNPFW